MTRLSRRAFALGTAATLIGTTKATVSRAQARPKIRIGSLTLPVFAPIIVNIMKARGFDTKNGFDADVQVYPSFSAYYAGLATGEIDTLIGGPTYFQKLRLEGVPLKIIATGATLADLVIVSKDPAIKSLADLKGKQLAADMGSGQFQILSICARSNKIDLAKDMTLVNANFAVARAQLAAGRVDAAMLIEPIATMMIKDDPAVKIVFNANDAWKQLTGGHGWELVYAMREDTIKKTPDAPVKFIAALQDVTSYLRSDPDGADRIAVDTVKLPPGVLKEAVLAKRWEFDAKPAWGDERKGIWDTFERAVTAGFHPRLPDQAIIYAP
ncbi:MAG: alkanesulfonate transporter substrate-binding subunit [Tardiphaga sp.]|uniref:ABC transporter substrate-binding protein n=1 Tax=Tardiphaga sp. TaxID=1926292 RepID=UPI00261F5FC9|nr:ABC transporter substrate-binding protein [Tardiphaga sp.]MDB5502353.1 alkanesulfonate transporter substrate-binding subunit [Tardiphaga sp.]